MWCVEKGSRTGAGKRKWLRGLSVQEKHLSLNPQHLLLKKAWDILLCLYPQCWATEMVRSWELASQPS